VESIYLLANQMSGSSKQMAGSCQMKLNPLLVPYGLMKKPEDKKK
jgi:hypothetical protein